MEKIVNCFFSKKQRKLYRLFLMAENLERKLSWIPSCEDGLDRILEFFREITPLEEYYYSSVEDLFFLSRRKSQFIYNLSTFMFRVGKIHNEWNKTEKGEIPSEKSIFIYVDFETVEIYEDQNLRINTVPLSTCIDKKKGNHKEIWRGQLKKETEIMNQISLEFLKRNYSFFKNSIDIFRSS